LSILFFILFVIAFSRRLTDKNNKMKTEFAFLKYSFLWLLNKLQAFHKYLSYIKSEDPRFFKGIAKEFFYIILRFLSSKQGIYQKVAKYIHFLYI